MTELTAGLTRYLVNHYLYVILYDCLFFYHYYVIDYFLGTTKILYNITYLIYSPHHRTNAIIYNDFVMSNYVCNYCILYFIDRKLYYVIQQYNFYKFNFYNYYL